MINHLWQSTLFAIAAAILTLMFRKNRAQVRYWLWFSASLKFLIPFSLLMSLGSRVEWAPAAPAPPVRAGVAVSMVQFAEPFQESVSFVPSTPNNWIPIAILSVWAGGFVSIALMRLRGWLRIRTAVRSSVATEFLAPIPVRYSPGLLEPGVVGWLRPILLLPAGIEQRLSPPQLEAVLAHELCHIRRRDNLTGAIHMIVEAIFWFHPLVWWIGSRLVEERERACDEAVLSLGSEPHIYAEGILNVCKNYLESPLRCVSGVTGSDLKKRIQAILIGRVAGELNFAKKAVLAAVGLATLAAPLIFGVLSAPFLRAQSALLGTPGQPRPAFEVASVKWIDREKMQGNHEGHELTPERFVDRTELIQFISMAYFRDHVCTLKTVLGWDCPLIAGSVPEWVKNDRFEIQAKLAANSLPSYTALQLSSGDTPELHLMLQVLLEDRFQLRVHREMRDLPVYALTVGKNGPKLNHSSPGPELVKAADGSMHEVHAAKGIRRIPTPDGSSRIQLNFRRGSMQEVVELFGQSLDRPVLDRTGLKGDYDVVIEYEDEPRPRGIPPTGMLPGATASALSAALQEVGLRLESTKAPIEVLVIDHIERPTEN